MNPLRHPTNNACPAAPANWDQSEAPCQALPVTVAIEDGVPVLNSWWQPTEQERLALLAGAPVLLTICGRSQPPVRLSVDLAA